MNLKNNITMWHSITLGIQCHQEMQWNHKKKKKEPYSPNAICIMYNLRLFCLCP